MMTKLFKTIVSFFIFIILFCYSILFLFPSLSSCSSNKFQIIKAKPFDTIINDIASNNCPALFFGNSSTVTLNQIMMLGLADLFYDGRNNHPDNDVIFMLPQSSVYDYNSRLVKNNTYNFNWILENYPGNNMLSEENLINHLGNYMYYTNTNNFYAPGYHHDDQGFYDDRVDQNGDMNIVAYDNFLDNILLYYDNTTKFDIFISNLNMTFYFNSSKHFSRPFFELLRRSNHIYLLSEGSTDWVIDLNNYKDYYEENPYDINWEETWNTIFKNELVNNEVLYKNNFYKFYDWYEKVTLINCADANYWASSNNINFFIKQCKKTSLQIPSTFDYRYSNYFGGCNEIINAIEWTFDIHGNDYKYLLDENFNISFDPSKKSLIILTGKEWFIKPEEYNNSTFNWERRQVIANCAINEIQDFFNSLCKKYPKEQYNYILKFHPKFNENETISQAKKILGEKTNNICVIKSKYPIELIFAKDYFLSLSNGGIGNIFDWNGNYADGIFCYKSVFAGFDIRSTSYETTLTMMNYDHLNSRERLKRGWNLVNQETNVIPLYFESNGSGTIPYNYPDDPKDPLDTFYYHNLQYNKEYLSEMENIGLVPRCDSYFSSSVFTGKSEKEDYIKNYLLEINCNDKVVTNIDNKIFIDVDRNTKMISLNLDKISICNWDVTNVSTLWDNTIKINDNSLLVRKVDNFHWEIQNIDNIKNNYSGELILKNNKESNNFISAPVESLNVFTNFIININITN